MPFPLYKLRKRIKQAGQKAKQEGQRIKQMIAWSQLPKATLVQDFHLDNFGGDNLFIDDINQDGAPELLWLQSQGIFKSGLYTAGDKKKYLHQGRGLTCLTATDTAGNILWQHGTPYQAKSPYCSHAAERMLDFFIDPVTGTSKIILLQGIDSITILNGADGQQEISEKLPADNFANVRAIQSGNNIYFIVGVMADSYESHSYGNPSLILDQNLNILNTIDTLGSGHRLWIHDFDGDGQQEALIGYEGINLAGEQVVQLDYWHGREELYEAKKQHLDCIAPLLWQDEWYAAIAGSDKLYFIKADGQVLWDYTPGHAQDVQVGGFQGKEQAPMIMMIDNVQRAYLYGFSVTGEKLWEKETKQNWPMGRPACVKKKQFHMGVPAVSWQSPDQRSDLYIYSEGGWPYGISSAGEAAVTFPYTAAAKKAEYPIPLHRGDDFGYAYQTRVHDLDQDNEQEVIIYDRQHAWFYRLPKNF